MQVLSEVAFAFVVVGCYEAGSYSLEAVLFRGEVWVVLQEGVFFSESEFWGGMVGEVVVECSFVELEDAGNDGCWYAVLDAEV